VTSLELLKQHVINAVESRRDELIHLADTIYANPEIAFEEYQSATLLCDTLEQNDFAVRRGVAGLETAFVATLNGKVHTPKIALLAEYDALPEIGHACGHNLIGASAVGAALALQTVLPELTGAVQVIGTPAEEGGGGKAIMVEAGVFDPVDVAMMIHPSNRNMTRRRSLSSYKISIEFFGKSSHAAAAPEEGINALDAMILTFSGINALRQHLRDDVRIHGIITHGGHAVNVVPEYAAAKFCVRAADIPYTRQVLEKVRACAEAGAQATGARLEFKEYAPHYEPIMPNPVLADLVDANMAALDIQVRLPYPNERMGSSDMGNVSQVVPALHPYIAIGPDTVVGHTVEFRELAGSPAGHEGMLQAAKIMAMTTIDLLAGPGNLAAVKQAFEDQRQPQG